MALNIVLKCGWKTLQNFALVNLMLESERHLAENFDSIDQLLRKFNFFHPFV
jgi:hypothetical protein